MIDDYARRGLGSERAQAQKRGAGILTRKTSGCYNVHCLSGNVTRPNNARHHVNNMGADAKSSWDGNGDRGDQI